MDNGLLKRLGTWLLVAAAALYVYGQLNPSPSEPPWRTVAAVGGLALLVGVALELIGIGRRKCQRCSRTAEKGSVFCATHHRELGRLRDTALARNQRDNRGW